MFKKSSQTHGEVTRFTALVVVFVFSLTSVVWTTPVQAATTDVVASSVLSLDSLKIPAEIGTVNRVYRGNQTEDEGYCDHDYDCSEGQA